MSSFPSVGLLLNNNQYLAFGPVTEYLTGTIITDLVVTASLYQGRDINNPSKTPGSLIQSFGASGRIVIPHVGGGIYRALVPAFDEISPGTYVLVLDAPRSSAGYQFHRERLTIVSVG